MAIWEHTGGIILVKRQLDRNQERKWVGKKEDVPPSWDFKKYNIKRRENNTWIGFHCYDLFGRCFLLHLQHTCMNILFGTRIKRFTGVYLFRGSTQSEFVGTGLELHPLLQVPTPHCLTQQGYKRVRGVSRRPNTLQPDEDGSGAALLPGRSAAPVLTCPLKHIQTLTGLHIPSFVHLVFSARLPRLLIIFKVSVIQPFGEALYPDRYDHWFVLCTPQSGSASTLCWFFPLLYNKGTWQKPWSLTI